MSELAGDVLTLPLPAAHGDPSELLRAYRIRRGLSSTELAALLGHAIGRPSLTGPAVDAWESGRFEVPHSVLTALPALDRLARPATPERMSLERSPRVVDERVGDRRAVDQLLADAGLRSAGFGEWADSLAIGDLALESLRLSVGQLAHAYVHAPMLPVVDGLVTARDHLASRLQSPDPTQAQSLWFLQGIVCGLLAHASGNLGNRRAADLQARTALVCARHAQHPTLAAWILGVQALQSEWSDELEEALAWIAKADRHLTGTPPSSVHTWLRAIEARACARLGRVADTERAIHASLVSRERLSSVSDVDDLDQIGGILSFSEAKHHYYIGAAWRRIGRLTLAGEHAQIAIAAYGSSRTEDRSYGDEALARINLAITYASAERPEMEAAWECLVPVFNLPEDMRIASLTDPLRELRDILANPALLPSGDARDVHDAVEELLVTCQHPLGSVRP